MTTTRRAYETDLTVRYRDLDPRGHVNHAVYVTYFEEAKAAFFEDVLGVPLDEAPTVVRALEVDYAGSITLDEEVTVDLVVTDIGTTSFTIEYDLFTGRDRVATGSTVSVFIEPATGQPRPLPDDWRDSLGGSKQAT